MRIAEIASLHIGQRLVQRPAALSDSVSDDDGRESRGLALTHPRDASLSIENILDDPTKDARLSEQWRRRASPHD